MYGASSFGHIEVVKYFLVEQGSNINIEKSIFASQKQASSLHLCILCKGDIDLDLIAFMKTQGDNVIQSQSQQPDENPQEDSESQKEEE